MVPRQSMNEAQLRALLPLNGQPPRGGPSTPFLPVNARSPMNPHRTALLPPRPLVTPSIAPLPHNATHANNARLLSILNTPNPVFRA
ncbi:hypothetical protein ONZ51_g12562 [Trametes cubensis]|uniref:Uncharacterized protein n=1 Tax=Trametes cubensis TaxID=1111947 RepID=A0AAD7TGY8_9APHY|nr:hypothetical protein ONZ51_g12562 [Trametes cubensis]